MAQNSLKTSATIVPTDQLLLSSAADGHRAAGRQVMKYFKFYIFCNVSVFSKKTKQPMWILYLSLQCQCLDPVSVQCSTSNAMMCHLSHNFRDVPLSDYAVLTFFKKGVGSNPCLKNKDFAMAF